MTIAIMFWALVLICCSYGFLFGGRDGRRVAFVYVAAVILTVPAQLVQGTWSGGIHWPVFAVDLGLFLGLYLIAMHARRCWPLWIAGFHLITLSTHLATLVTPSFAFQVYFGLANLWSVPKLLVIVIGVTLDRRTGISGDDGTFDRSAG